MHFGSGIVTKDDVILNNQMGDFSIPGYHEDRFNYPAPNKRPRSGMAPMIVHSKNSLCSLRMCIGGVNGSRIFTGVGQVLSNIVGLGMSIPDAVNVSRLFPIVFDKVIEYDRPEKFVDFKTALEEKGHILKIDNYGVNSVNIAGKVNDDALGYADPRHAGMASVF